MVYVARLRRKLLNPSIRPLEQLISLGIVYVVTRVLIFCVPEFWNFGCWPRDNDLRQWHSWAALSQGYGSGVIITAYQLSRSQRSGGDACFFPAVPIRTQPCECYKQEGIKISIKFVKYLKQFLLIFQIHRHAAGALYTATKASGLL